MMLGLWAGVLLVVPGKQLPACGWLTLSVVSPIEGETNRLTLSRISRARRVPEGERDLCPPSTHGLDPLPVEQTGMALAARGRVSLYEHMF